MDRSNIDPNDELEYLNNDCFVYGGFARAIIFGKSIRTAEYNKITSIVKPHLNKSDIK